MKNQNLKQAIRNLYDDFSKRDLPQYITDRLKQIMKKNSVELNKESKEK